MLFTPKMSTKLVKSAKVPSPAQSPSRNFNIQITAQDTLRIHIIKIGHIIKTGIPVEILPALMYSLIWQELYYMYKLAILPIWSVCSVTIYSSSWMVSGCNLRAELKNLWHEWKTNSDRCQQFCFCFCFLIKFISCSFTRKGVKIFRIPQCISSLENQTLWGYLTSSSEREILV